MKKHFHKKHFMKRKILAFCLLLILCALCSGCGGKKVKEAVEAGYEALENQAYKEAIDHFEEVVAIATGPTLQDVYRGEGIAYFRMEDYQNAARCFQAALGQSRGRVSEKELDLCYYKAEAQYKNGDAAGAKETYSNLIEYDGKNWKAYYLRGLVSLDLKKISDAASDFDRAVELNKADGKMYIQMYEAMDSGGYGQQGRVYLEKLLENSGEEKGDRLHLGIACYYLGDREKARDYLEQALEAKKTEGYYYLAQIAQSGQDHQEALNNYEQYLSARPEDGAVWNELGLYQMSQEDYKGALDSFQKGIKTGEETSAKALRRNEIAACERMGDFAAAKAKTEEYLARYPQDGDALREQEFLRTR